VQAVKPEGEVGSRAAREFSVPWLRAGVEAAGAALPSRSGWVVIRVAALAEVAEAVAEPAGLVEAVAVGAQQTTARKLPASAAAGAGEPVAEAAEAEAWP